MKKSILTLILLLTLLPSVFAINLLDNFNNLFNNNNSNLITGNVFSFFSIFGNKPKCTSEPICRGNNVVTLNKNCKVTKTQPCKSGEKCSGGACVPKKECNPQMRCRGNNIIFQDSKCDICGASSQYCVNGCKEGVCNPDSAATSTNPPSNPSNPYGNACVAGWTCDRNNYRYRHGDCGFEQDYYTCSFGCSNGQCNTDPNAVGNSATCTLTSVCRDGKPGFILPDCLFQPSLTSWCPNGCNSQGTGCACADNTYCILDSNGQTVSVQHDTADCRSIVEHCINGCGFSGGIAHCIQETTCTSGWMCEGNNVVFKNGDCSKISYGINCQNGCSNGQCNPPKPPCDPGPICLNDNTIGYQGADCNICGKSTCKFGCEDGKCKTENLFPYPVPSVPSTITTASPGCKINKPYCDGNNIVEESLVNGICKKNIKPCANKCSTLTNACNPSTAVPGGIAVPGRKIIKAY